MPQSTISRLLATNKWLLLSLAANICLLAVCAALLSELKKTYTEYRHFRALPIGTSKATEAVPTDDSVVLFGDSRIEIWYPYPYSDKYNFINAGVTGETTSEMRRRFERDVVALKPEFVVIQAGVNDLTAAVTRGIAEPQQLINTMHENLQYFIKTLEAQDIDVVVTSILPALPLNLLRRQFWHNELTAQINDANDKLEQITLSADAEWLDLDHLFMEQSGEAVAHLYRDTLHINQKGYDVLNKHLKEYIDNL